MPLAKTMESVLLARLARQINEAHEAGKAGVRRGLEHYHACGKALLIVRKAQPHGEWLPWLKTHCPKVGARQARRYMRLAKTDVKSDLEEAWKVICGNARREASKPPKKSKAPQPNVPDDGSRCIGIKALPKAVADEVMPMLDDLTKIWDTKDVTDTVVRAIRYTHQGLKACKKSD